MRAGVIALGAALLLAACGNDGRKESVRYDLVTVGDPGNAPDSTGFGAVAYPFRIGKYPVTYAALYHSS